MKQGDSQTGPARADVLCVHRGAALAVGGADVKSHSAAKTLDFFRSGFLKTSRSPSSTTSSS